MKEKTIAEIYQDMGRLLRKEGAEQIYILTSKIISSDPWILTMELVVDHVRDFAGAQRMLQKQYPEFEILLLDGENPDHYDILAEGAREGIHL